MLPLLVANEELITMPSQAATVSQSSRITLSRYSLQADLLNRDLFDATQLSLFTSGAYGLVGQGDRRGFDVLGKVFLDLTEVEQSAMVKLRA